jgi:hypothetical protein
VWGANAGGRWRRSIVDVSIVWVALGLLEEEGERGAWEHGSMPMRLATNTPPPPPPFLIWCVLDEVWLALHTYHVCPLLIESIILPKRFFGLPQTSTDAPGPASALMGELSKLYGCSQSNFSQWMDTSRCVDASVVCACVVCDVRCAMPRLLLV